MSLASAQGMEAMLLDMVYYLQTRGLSQEEAMIMIIDAQMEIMMHRLGELVRLRARYAINYRLGRAGRRT
jgi:Fe-S cluster assembly scaffold protein SufB